MEKFEYNCHYCGKSYVPKRRYVQQYCCTSCRVNAHKRRTKSLTINSEKSLSLPQNEAENKQKINMAGIGNAAIANMATDLAKNFFTREENKPATKGDIQALINQSQKRYLPVKNAPQKNDGTMAYYDCENNIVIYKQFHLLSINHKIKY